MTLAMIATSRGFGLRVNLSEASAPISYMLDGEEVWRSTPFQTADAQHNPAAAIDIVDAWLNEQE